MSKGDNEIERSLYLINIGDWVSYYLAELRKFDPIEVKVIDHLKAELAN
jgi:glucose/mannose-6-phosphate isomerase